MSTPPTQTRPLATIYRWLVMFAVSLVCFAQYYVYDSVTPLATSIKEQLHFSGADYGLLFFFYSLPNVLLLMVVVAGVLVDRLGIKLSGILYAFLCFLGAVITALGASAELRSLLGPAYAWLQTAFLPEASPGLKIMLLGRMIYGVGAEGILVVNNKVLARWFGGKELALAFGLNLTLMRLGTFLALNVQAPAAEAWSLPAALWLAATVMAAGFLSFGFYIVLERSAAGRVGAPQSVAASPGDAVPTSAIWYLARLVAVLSAAGLVWLWRPGLVQRPLSIGALLAVLLFLVVFRVPQAYRFNASFWAIALLCVTFYSAVFPFQAYAPDILVQKFGYSVTKAGHFSSALVFGTMIFTPIFGWIVDHKGRRATLMILGAVLLIPCHLLLGYTRFPPVVPIFFVGVSLSLVPAALWAAIPMMVPEKRLGTAFGIVGWVQNVGLMLFPWLAGRIADAHTTVLPSGESVVDYTSTMLLFVALGVAGLAFAVLLKWADARRRDGTSIEKVLLT